MTPLGGSRNECTGLLCEEKEVAIFRLSQHQPERCLQQILRPNMRAVILAPLESPDFSLQSPKAPGLSESLAVLAVVAFVVNVAVAWTLLATSCAKFGSGIA